MLVLCIIAYLAACLGFAAQTVSAIKRCDDSVTELFLATVSITMFAALALPFFAGWAVSQAYD